MVKTRIKIPLLILASIFLLYGCGESKEELKKKEDIVVMKHYTEDFMSEKDKKLAEKERLAKMTDEEKAELEVDKSLDLVSSTDGTYKTYGIDEELPSYVKASIEDGLTIPKEGKVVILDPEDDTEDYMKNEDDLSMALAQQRTMIDSNKLRVMLDQERVTKEAELLLKEKEREEAEAKKLAEENKKEN